MIPIEYLRQRVGLEPDDSSEDAQIEVAEAITIAMLETWLDRRLALGPDSEAFTHFRGKVLSLRRYPLVPDSVVLTLDEQTYVTFHADEETGLVHLDGRQRQHRITVAYEGGYLEMPPALMGAALLVFDSVWAVVGGTDGGATTSGAIRSITIPDVGTVQYATGSDGATSAEVSEVYGIPALYVGIIERFRRQYA